MKRFLVCLILSLGSTATASPMARVIGVRDSRTIVVAVNGVTSAVTLKNVVIEPAEEVQAADYLRGLVGNQWVFVDAGDVYRSPDALYVNGDMNRHGWRTMKYLGQLDLGIRGKGQPAGKSVKPVSMPPPLKSATPAPRRITSRSTRSGGQ